jgi:hypothetical protein
MAIVLAALVAGALIVVSPVSADETSAEVAAPTDGVVAFYFHGNVRCATCRKIEAYADEAIHTGFAKALEDGTLTWSVVNIDEEENKHFVEDFQLTTRSVVLAEYRDGQLIRHENLDKVWQLVRSQQDFVDYVQDETGAFFEKN